MKKNVGSQVIGVQMVSAADGSAFTGAVSVAVTVDGGPQGAGGGTGPTHEGNGFHSYVPTQAETNGDHLAFTFTGTGAIPMTVQVYTEFPQTGDAHGRIGEAGAGLTALGDPRVANLDVAISTRATAAALAAVSALVDDLETRLTAVRAGLLDNLSNLDVPVSTRGTGDATAASQTAILAYVDELEARLTAVRAGLLDNLAFLTAPPPTATENADAHLKRDVTAITGPVPRHSPLNLIRKLGFVEVSPDGTTLTVYAEDGSTVVYTQAVTTKSDQPPIRRLS